MGEYRRAFRVSTSRNWGKGPVRKPRRRCTCNVNSDVSGLGVVAERSLGSWANKYRISMIYVIYVAIKESLVFKYLSD